MEYNAEFDWNFIQKLVKRLTSTSNELYMKEAENITKMPIDMTNLMMMYNYD